MSIHLLYKKALKANGKPAYFAIGAKKLFSGWVICIGFWVMYV
jgi:hypothetical protein